MKEDKKTDPNNLARQEQILVEIEEKKSSVLVNATRLKSTKIFSLEAFKGDENFDYKAAYRGVVMKERETKAMLAETRDLMAKERDALKVKTPSSPGRKTRGVPRKGTPTK